MAIEKIFGDYVFPVSHVSKKMEFTDFFFGLFLGDELNLIITLTNLDPHKDIFPETTRSEILKFFGVLIFITRYKFVSWRDLWY